MLKINGDSPVKLTSSKGPFDPPSRFEQPSDYNLCHHAKSRSFRSDAPLGSFALPAGTRLRSRFFQGGTAYAHRDRDHGGDDGPRDHRGSDVTFDGVAGRWLAYEHACNGVPYYCGGLLSRTKTCLERAVQFRDRKNWCARRFRERRGALSRGGADGRRINAQVIRSVDDSF